MAGAWRCYPHRFGIAQQRTRFQRPRRPTLYCVAGTIGAITAASLAGVECGGAYIAAGPARSGGPSCHTRTPKGRSLRGTTSRVRGPGDVELDVPAGKSAPTLPSEQASARRPAMLGALAGGVGLGVTAAAALASAAGVGSSRTPGLARGTIAGGALPLTVGMGTCLVSERDVESQVTQALEEGYRVFDTAQRYMNEAGLGSALQKAFDKGISRDDVFVITKVWPDNYGYDKTIASVKESASRLSLDRIDLVLPHWPGFLTRLDFKDEARGRAAGAAKRRDTWRALEELRRQGTVSQIGVSNFDARRLEEVFTYAEERPTVNQFEVHPLNARQDLVDLCNSQGVLVNSYSPLGGKGNKKQVTDVLLKSPTIKRIADAHGKTSAQVILRWHLQRQLTPIPKTTRRARMKENLAVFDFELTEAEVQEMTSMDQKKFVIMDSAVFF